MFDVGYSFFLTFALCPLPSFYNSCQSRIFSKGFFASTRRGEIDFLRFVSGELQLGIIGSQYSVVNRLGISER